MENNRGKIMKYTQSMTAELHSIGSFTYETAAAFAEKHGVSTRSVISKVKFEQLPYEPKTTKAKRVRKSEVVGLIASALNVPLETIEGLAKADMASLKNLLGNI